jgi:peptidyl-prolyl cis-trans isomerase C
MEEGARAVKAILLMCAATLCTVLAARPAAAQEVLAARVNGTGITIQQVEGTFDEGLKEKKLHLLQIRDPNKVKGMKREALDQLINQELLWQAAERKGMVASDKDVDAAFEQAKKSFKSEERFKLRLEQEGYTEDAYKERIRKKLSGDRYADSLARTAKVTDKDIHDFYLANPKLFQRPEMVRARHILITVASGATEEQRAAARKKIDAVLIEARSGRSFDELARLHSEDATKQWGGELDPFARGQVDPAFEQAAFALKPGEISEVVTSPYGFHIIKLEEHIPAVTISEKQAKDRIKGYLEAQRGKEAVDKELQSLRASAKVEILIPF